MFCVCLPGPSWGLHMDYTPGTLCPAWTPCMLAAGTQPSQITRLLSWKKQHTNRKKRSHIKRLCSLETTSDLSHFFARHFYTAACKYYNCLKLRYCSRTNLQCEFGYTKLQIYCMQAEGQDRFWHCCCLVFMHASWTCFHDNGKTLWPALQHLLPWRPLAGLSCLGGSSRKNTWWIPIINTLVIMIQLWGRGNRYWDLERFFFHLDKHAGFAFHHLQSQMQPCK